MLDEMLRLAERKEWKENIKTRAVISVPQKADGQVVGVSDELVPTPPLADTNRLIGSVLPLSASSSSFILAGTPKTEADHFSSLACSICS